MKYLHSLLQVTALSCLATLASCAASEGGDDGSDAGDFDEAAPEESGVELAPVRRVDVAEESAPRELTPPGLHTQTVGKTHATDIRAMTLNIRINELKDDRPKLLYISARKTYISHLIDSVKPDIIAFQEAEEDTLRYVVNEIDSNYDWWYQTRGGISTPKEAVVLGFHNDRFEFLETNSITITRKERRDAGGCPNTPGFGNRNVLRVKLLDKLTNLKVDVFNTHFPSRGTDNNRVCEQEGMAEIVYDYVHKFGDNVMLMGDFNAGFSKSGALESPFRELTRSGFLVDTYRQHNNIQTSGEHLINTRGRSFITGSADVPKERLGRKIDHVFVAPAFQIRNTGIDRQMWDGPSQSLVDCAEWLTKVNEDNERTHCWRDGWESVQNFYPYSDHWAVWADVRRIDCENSGCAASK